MSPLSLITGASSGIGRAFAYRLAAEGHDLIVVGRRADRLCSLAASLPATRVQIVVADLATDEGLRDVADVMADQPVSMLVNNAGVAHYMPFAELPANKAGELIGVKVTAPTTLMRAAVPGMVERNAGIIVNVAGMLAFSGPAPAAPTGAERAVYTGTLAYLVAMSQTLRAELDGTGVQVHVVCPGIVATEFHEVQGMDLSAVPRMSAEDVVTATLVGISLGETVIAPGVEDHGLLARVFDAEVDAFCNQSPVVASRYQQPILKES